MLRKEKSLSIRGFSGKKNRSRFIRPNSTRSKKKFKFSALKVNNNYYNQVPPPIFTMPNTKKMINGMGNKIEREQLYENNMQLKDIINHLRKELAEVKNKVVKKDIEIRKKEKLIKECSKENDLESTHELNLEKARESTLVSLYKQQYNELKESYNKKVKEYNELSSTYKITKLKEYLIQIDVMKKEMEKMRNLYMQTVENNNKLNLEIQNFKELKKYFVEQHGIIESLEKTIKQNKEEINKLQKINEEYKNRLEQNIKKQKILKNKNFKLKISNKKYLDIKKNRENYEIFIDDNKKHIENLKKELDEYKRLYELTRREYNKIQEQRDKKEHNKLKNEENNPMNHPFQAMGIIEVKQENKDTNKLSLYKSLVEEYKIKIDIYEIYLKKIGIDKDALIKAFGYDGVVTSSTKINTNEVDNFTTNLASIETNPNNNINTENSEEINKDQSVKNINNIVHINDNINPNPTPNNANTNKNSISTSNNFNNNDKLPSIEEEKQDEAQYSDENQLLSLLHVFVKNLEANGITKEQINQKIDEISKLFENKTEATKEEFIDPFIKMFIETMHITKKEDVEIVGGFLNDFVDSLNGEISIFFNGLIEVFDNVNDYTGINKDCELAFKLSKYKDELISSLKKIDSNNTHLITFETFRKIVHDLNLLLDDESMEYLIYKMKKDVPENNSIFDLNYDFIENLLQKNEIKDTLMTLKKNLDDKKTNLDAECLELINTFEYQGKKFMIVKKEDFFTIFGKFDMKLSREIIEGIYECFKIEIEGEVIEKQDWIDYERIKSEIE